MADAMAAAGLDAHTPGRDEEALARIGTYVELHVEQGRGLADGDAPVGVATAIRPHGRWRLDLRGRADHAGTTRLQDRRDPMLALAAVLQTARDAAALRDIVATVGKVLVAPNAVNAIPSRVTAWLDARGLPEAAVRGLVAEVGAAGGIDPVEESWTPATVFDPALRDRVAAAVGGDLGPAPLLDTGAGHDAGVLAAAGIPSAMLFVRNPTGVSHSPAEHAETADCLAGVDALAQVVRELA
jgi:N-carbamoyl-L-amino-acid hydrolase